MISKVQQVFSLLLLSVLLMGSIGVPVSKHICFISGHADVALFTTNYKGCCTAKQNHCNSEQEQAMDCCGQEDEYLKLDVPKKHEELQKLVQLNSFELPFLLSWAVQGAVKETFPRYFLSDLSPPSTGQDILVDHQVFRL